MIVPVFGKRENRDNHYDQFHLESLRNQYLRDTQNRPLSTSHYIFLSGNQ